MITEDLTDYILAQTRKNIPRSTIALRLENAGWHKDDVQEAFTKLYPPQVPKEAPTIFPTSASFAATNIATPAANPVVERPIEQLKRTEPIKPIFATGFKEAHIGVPPIIVAPTVTPPLTPNSTPTPTPGYYIPDNFTETPGSRPITIEPVKVTPNPVIAPLIDEVKESIPNVVEKPVIQPIAPIQPVPLTPAPAPTPIIIETKVPVVPPVTPPTPIVQKIVEPKVPFVPIYNPTPIYEPKIESASASVVPANAMLYSYPQEVSQANKLNNQIHTKNKKKMLKWIVGIVLLSFVAGAGFAIAAKYIKFPSFNLSMIKKDPRTILASAVPLQFDSVKSYKIQTNATISLPSFANISSGLATGDKITSTDTDFLAISAKGLVDNSSAPTLLFDYAATISSSLFKKDITTDLKYNNGIAFLTTPDVRQLIGNDAPPVGTVLIQDGQFEPLIQLLPDDIQNLIDKIDMHKMLSVGLPAYINSDIASIFKDFINSASVIEKAPEVINGIDTYHYELSADSISTKTFLTRFGNLFLGDVPGADKEDITQALGSVSIDTLEVWVGKKDNIIYQYKFTATVPLSKVIGLNDKGIAGKTVRLDWKTTYSDFDIPNQIILPTNAISVASFMNIVNDVKVKNLISSFNTPARNLHNAIGVYGKRANTTGSCTNPNPSSLFSPVGHTAGSTQAVGDIAGSVNEILNLTNGALACYSTPESWAIAAPLLSRPFQYVCSDSTGQTTTLAANISSPACK